MKLIQTYIVDSFTEKPFKGNPAGVCLVDNEIEANTMLEIAKELGLSETAFVRKLDNSKHHSIRYFSPKKEIALCGHATLAASKVLFNNDKKLKDLILETGEMKILDINKNGDYISMEFPAYNLEQIHLPKSLLEALGIDEFIYTAINREMNMLLIEIANAKQLKQLQPHYDKLISSYDDIDGVAVTSKSDQAEMDYELRYFWPWSGTNEDPVTGATQTFLAKYWANKLGKTEMRAFQSSERTGVVEVKLLSDHKVLISGNAHILLSGSLML
ncbi:PhzF family phenazine biosynthesis protein [Fulvivirga lutea]|uniref:PhzF family phenazine biosynthesis protein n=1 Tax=Fulvivirga lutea TaxID=2810512 RepID=A0A974WJ16_9BACT|nr:PhzF family phenazine biosynthesis protein [Fulvivirga lutea]QSE98663.1 PhzF family phenazine biosynthesis protein [Fulvivirga lutea]